MLAYVALLASAAAYHWHISREKPVAVRPISTLLLATKFYCPPPRPNLVPRPQLLKRLDAGLHQAGLLFARKLTLVSAPAGYGKTTIIAEWLGGKDEIGVTWLSLDDSDNDPRRFLDYLLAALRQIQADVGRSVEAMLQSPEPPPNEALLTTLVNELAAIARPFILVLDDYHVIRTSPIHGQLNFLLEHQPPPMHLVIITREDPPLSLARLRVRGQMIEVRQEDLRFSPKECADFVQRVVGLTLSAQDVAALERRTEGWIAGLQLAALSMRGHEDVSGFIQAFTGSSRFILDYLMEEVFERQTPDVKDFLLKTSVLERMCGALCDSVISDQLSVNSQSLLEYLEHANLFVVPLDQSRVWYRYHHLFAELLRHRLRAFHAEPELHQRASGWFEAEGFVTEAIQHALAAQDWERTLRLIHFVMDGMIKRGEVFTLLNWYSQIPHPMIRGNAETCLEYGWFLLLTGQFEQAGVYIAYAEGFDRDDPSFVGQLLNAQAYLARAQGDLRRMVALSQQALAVLPKEDVDARCIVAINLAMAYWHSGNMDAAESALTEVLETGKATGNFYAISMAAIYQGMTLAVRGRLREAHERFQAIAQQEDMPAFIRCAVYLYLSCLQYEWNHLEQSGKYLLEAIKINERIQNDELFISNCMMMARLHMASGHLQAAGEALDKAQQKAIEGEFSVPAMPRLAAARVRHAIACNDLASASRWAEHLAEGCDWHPFYRFTDTAQALHLLAANKPGEASSHLEGCFERASQEGWLYGVIVIRALQALAAAKLEAALEYLTDALKWAQPEGFVRTFVDLGKGLEPLLQAAIRRRVMPDYAEKILSAMKDGAQKSILGQLALVEPLSERELEVLRLMAAGLSNREIAENLIIGVATAKTHVHNVCGKLGVRNRTEAAMQAKELGLV